MAEPATRLERPATRPRIVVLGGGFAGAYCARELEKRLRGEAEVVLVDRNNYFLFTPLLVEAGTGSLEPRHTVVSLRAFIKRATLLQAEVLAIDTADKRVHYRISGLPDEGDLRYDHLVVALGSVTRLPPVPGLAEHGRSMKSLGDAIALRDRAIAMLEAADASLDPDRRRSLLHFVVVGANLTGVEVAGELDMFLRVARARRYKRVRPDEIRMTLIERLDRILPVLDPDLADFALRTLEHRRIDVRLRRSVASLAEDHVVLDDGEVLPTHTVVWAAGIAPHPLVARAGLPTDERGWILCDQQMRVQGVPDVWSIGDIAYNPDPSGQPYPATAQHASRQGEHLARNLVRVLRGQPPKPFVHRDQGTLAALGCRTAVARVFGIKLSGFWAWFLWRTVYLLKMPGLARKVRVAMDWTLGMFFPRDIVALGLARKEQPR